MMLNHVILQYVVLCWVVIIDPRSNVSHQSLQYWIILHHNVLYCAAVSCILLQNSKSLVFLIEALRKHASLRLGPQELQNIDVINKILTEINQAEPGTARAPNDWFS